MVSSYEIDVDALCEQATILNAETINRLKYEKPNIQYYFRNQNIIDKYLHFKQSEVVKRFHWKDNFW